MSDGREERSPEEMRAFLRKSHAICTSGDHVSDILIESSIFALFGMFAYMGFDIGFFWQGGGRPGWVWFAAICCVLAISPLYKVAQAIKGVRYHKHTSLNFEGGGGEAS